jgi:radical SAM superfamily enzyme YgiQ (UPF0313 family)
MNKKILLLNPPSNKTLQRDFICSSSSKANYYWPPIDLVVLSGILNGYNLTLVDAIVEKISESFIFNFIKKQDIEYVISLISSIDFENELSLLKKIKSLNPKIKIIVIGDIAFFEKDRVIKNDCIDAILLDFTSHEIIKYLNNSKNIKIKDMIYKINRKVVFNGFNNQKNFSYGKANLGLLNLKKYSVPYSIYSPIAPMLINYGCPYKCSFCASGRIGYKLREFEEVKEEIIDFKKKGFKEIFIRDFNFTTNKNFVKGFCNFMINDKINIVWSCEARVDNVDEEILSLMKKAGCFLIFFGVEVASQKKLEKFQKQTNIFQIKKVFNFCKKIGIKTLASFILALPGDTKKEILETIHFAKEINADYASFNLYVPRYGSPLREKLHKENKINLNKFDSSTEFINLTNISNKEMIKLHNYAIRSFYFRPTYLFRKLVEIKTLSQFKTHFLNGLSLFRNMLK